MGSLVVCLAHSHAIWQAIKAQSAIRFNRPPTQSFILNVTIGDCNFFAMVVILSDCYTETNETNSNVHKGVLMCVIVRNEGGASAYLRQRGQLLLERSESSSAGVEPREPR